MFRQGKPKWEMERSYFQRQKVEDALDENFNAIECKPWNAEVQWNTNTYLIDTVCDLVVKLERKARTL